MERSFSTLLSSGWILFVLLVGGLLYLLGRERRDIDAPTLAADLDWRAGSEEALEKVYSYVVAVGKSTVEWYQTRRSTKRRLGVLLRIGALLTAAAAGLVPLSEELIGPQIDGAWTTLLVASTGLFISVDRLGGFTSGWVRYMTAQQKVERLREAFLLDWNELKTEQASPQDMIRRAKAHIVAVGKVVDEETQEWATEFQNALKEMDKARKAAEKGAATGALEILLKNRQAVVEWGLEIDGSQRGQTSSESVAIADLRLGLHKVKVHGKDANGQALSAERMARIEGDTVTRIELELR